MKNFQNKAKIIKVSRALRTIAFAGLIMWAFTIVVLVGNAIIPPLIWKSFHFSISLFLSIPALLFTFIANLKIFLFFNRLKNGYLFDAQTVGNLDAAGTWLLMMWLYEIVWLVLRQGIYADNFDLSHVSLNWGTLFAALTVKFFAWFFQEAQELQEEQELTV